MKSFKDYQPSPVPDERETLARAVTEPDRALESSAAELTKKIAAAYRPPRAAPAASRSRRSGSPASFAAARSSR